MKKVLPLILIIFLFPITILIGQESQNNLSPNDNSQNKERKGKLFFSLGTEYRLGLVYNFGSDSETVWKSRGIDAQDLNRGSALFYSLDYFVSNPFSVGFSHSLRYDHLYQASQEDIAGGIESQSLAKDTYGLLMDYHLYLKYHFGRPQNQRFFAQVGISFLNNGPVINKNPITIVDRSGSHIDQSRLSLMDITTQFGVGYQKKRFNLMGGIYFSKENPYYEATSYFSPYIQFKYNLGNLFQ
jgi:hypothetical protein